MKTNYCPLIACAVLSLLAACEEEETPLVQEIQATADAGKSSLQELLGPQEYESFAYRYEKNHLVVDGEMNGQAGRFVISPGQHGNLVNLEFARKAGLNIGPMEQLTISIASSFPPNGICEVTGFKVGNVALPDQKLLATDFALSPADAEVPDCDAVLGRWFLHEFKAFIDFEKMRCFVRSRPMVEERAKEEGPNAK